MKGTIAGMVPFAALRVQAAQELFFRGTFAPFFLASESPIAIACLRLFTLPPRPLFPRRRVPLLRRRIALSTLLPALLPYRRLLDLREVLFFRAAISSPGWDCTRNLCGACPPFQPPQGTASRPIVFRSVPYQISRVGW
jgi:hypothetical protein